MKTTKARATVTGPGTTGTVVNVTMQGDGVFECAYTVSASIGGQKESFNLQVDTGSSDLWLVSTDCSSQSSCSTYSGPKYAPTSSNSTGQNVVLTGQSRTVSGPIDTTWVAIDGYTVNAQAFVAASNVQNTALSVGQGVSGLLGLGLQAESLVAQQLNNIPSVSGSTFSTNLFSNGTSPKGLTSPGPSTPFISLLLERPYYPTIPSRLGLGVHPPLPYSLSPSQVQFTQIASSSPGPLYWRIPFTQVTPYIKGAPVSLPLGNTLATGVSSIWPVALFDSSMNGMVSTRSFANAFYGAWSIGPGSQDGQYYVPCDLVMNVTFTLGQGTSIIVPLHPLDMSNTIQSQPTGSMCLGALQASDSGIPQADLILGAAFLRNVYTVMSYQTNPPQLGILPLTNPSASITEFNTVRVSHQPIGDGLSPSQQAAGLTSSFSGSTQVVALGNSNDKSTKLGLKVLGAVVGFLILSGGLLWLSVRLLRRRILARAGREEVKEWNDDVISVAGSEKRGRSKKSVLAYGGEEAFAMFGGGRGSDRVVDISAANSLTTSGPQEPAQVYQPGHRPQLSIATGRDSSDSLLGVGAFRDSRYPSSAATSLRSATSYVKSADGATVEVTYPQSD